MSAPEDAPGDLKELPEFVPYAFPSVVLPIDLVVFCEFYKTHKDDPDVAEAVADVDISKIRLLQAKEAIGKHKKAVLDRIEAALPYQDDVQVLLRDAGETEQEVNQLLKTALHHERALQRFLYEDTVDITKEADLQQRRRNNLEVCAEFIERVQAELLVPAELLHRLFEAEIDESYFKDIEAIGKIEKQLAKELQRLEVSPLLPTQPSEESILAETQSVIKTLRQKIIFRLFHFFKGKFAALAAPNTNVQMHQKSIFVKLAPLFDYIRRFHSDLATELRALYVKSVEPKISVSFTEYFRILSSLLDPVALKTDLLTAHMAVIEPSGVKSFVGAILPKTMQPASPGLTRMGSTPFSLSDRLNILYEDDVIVTLVALDSGDKYSISRIFSSWMKLLLSVVASEVWFQRIFFHEGEFTDFNVFFAPTIKNFELAVEGLLQQSYDTIGVGLVLALLEQGRADIHVLHVSHLDQFMATMRASVAKKFTELLSSQLQSLQSVSQLSPFTTRPHAVTRRTAEFICALIELRSHLNEGDAQKVTAKLTTMISRVLLLLRTSAPQVGKDLIHVALINNLDIFIAVLKERELNCSELTQFQQALQQEVAQLMRAELNKFFQVIMSVSDSSGSGFLKTATLTATVKTFHESWRSDFETLHNAMLAYFSNFALGANILRQTLTLAVHSYRVFLELLRTRYATLYDELKGELVPLDELNAHVDKLCADIV